MIDAGSNLRIAKLIHDYDVKPSNILALTFTNNSNEMKQRLQLF